jgi:hypothetical protein
MSTFNRAKRVMFIVVRLGQCEPQPEVGDMTVDNVSFTKSRQLGSQGNDVALVHPPFMTDVQVVSR